jgi:hypothetical protein
MATISETYSFFSLKNKVKQYIDILKKKEEELSGVAGGAAGGRSPFPSKMGVPSHRRRLRSGRRGSRPRL